MNTFKKIYTALMIITVICLVVVGLHLLDFIKLTGDTGEVVKQIVYTILPLTFLFSKAANVIANRSNVNLGYGITFALLIYLLFFVLQITVNLDLPTIVYLILFIILAYLILLTLIYEVPQANTAHKKFQKILMIIGTITFVLSILFLHSLDLPIISSFQNEQIKEAVREFADIIQIAFIAIGGVTLIGIIINPMMRVYHIDNDFVAINELDDALTRTTRYQANTQPNPNAILSDKYKKDVKKEDKIISFANKEQVVQELPTEVVSELPKEKVINQNFQQENIPNAEIPLILNTNENVTPAEQSTQSVPLETIQQPTTETNTDANQNIVEMAKTTANEVVASQPLEAVQQPTTETNTDTNQNIVEMAKATANEVVASQPLENIQQPAQQPAPEPQVTPTEPQPTSLEAQINNVPMQ